MGSISNTDLDQFTKESAVTEEAVTTEEDGGTQITEEESTQAA